MPKRKFSECINHPGGMFPSGYGAKWWLGATRKAHRVAYCQAHGLLPKDIEGIIIRHKCDNRACINPDHLEPGNHADNMRDMVVWQRSARGVRNSKAKLTPEQVAEIRRLFIPQSTEYGSVALSRVYGVSNSTINRIVRGLYWVAEAEMGTSMYSKEKVV
jgi:hypothetical protein